MSCTMGETLHIRRLKCRANVQSVVEFEIWLRYCSFDATLGDVFNVLCVFDEKKVRSLG